MTIALISDIHGNYEALQSVLEQIDSLHINDIYCLGDIVGYYTQVNECCELLRDKNIKCILGNHDMYLITQSGCARSKSANLCLEYQTKIISDTNIDWLKSLPIRLEVGQLSLVHGGWRDPLEEYVVPTEDYFSNFSNRYFASGHTHKQMIVKFGEQAYCNPGSVGQPRDDDPRAAFATFDGKNFNLHRVDYNINEVCRLMALAGFEEYYFNRLWVGSPHFV